MNFLPSIIAEAGLNSPTDFFFFLNLWGKRDIGSLLFKSLLSAHPLALSHPTPYNFFVYIKQCLPS